MAEAGLGKRPFRAVTRGRRERGASIPLPTRTFPATAVIAAFAAAALLRAPAASGQESPRPVHSFAYQLQNILPDSLARSDFDLFVIDFSADGGDESAFSAADVETVRGGSGGRRTVLSYLSIGEAEDYRSYWQPSWRPGNPEWLGPENPEWEGNHRVKYWDPAWQAVIFRYLEKILDAGFNGVYLDLVDAYGYFLDRGRASAARDMADFVAAIRSRARSRDPDFLIFPQNAAELGGLVPSYLDAVDGIGQEDLYYGYEADGLATPPEVTGEIERLLGIFRDAGKTVLTVDYPFASSEEAPHFDPATVAKIDRAYALSAGNGFVPYCTVRGLGFLTVNPGHAPTAVSRRFLPAAKGERASLSVHPNPGNGAFTVSFRPRAALSRPDAGPGSGSVLRVRVLDALGRCTATLYRGPAPTGEVRLRWDGSSETGDAAASGVYTVAAEWEGGRISAGVLLVR